jgi:hypothetical protein
MSTNHAILWPAADATLSEIEAFYRAHRDLMKCSRPGFYRDAESAAASESTTDTAQNDNNPTTETRAS